MAELLNLLFNPVSNAIMTVLTGISALYWMLTFIAGDFLGELDLGVDFDTDVDIATETDIDIDTAESTSSPSILSKALQFVNIGKVPFMVVLSTFKFIAWIGTLITSIVFNTITWGWKSVLLLLPIFIVTFFVTRYATKPLIKVYKQMGYNGEEKHDLLGRNARMKSSISGDKIGSAELSINNDLIRINVQSKNGKALTYQQEVTITDEDKYRNIYFVEPEINLNNVI